MDLSFPTPTTNLPLTPGFGDNVQDMLGTTTLRVSPSAIIMVNSIADAVDDLNSGVTTLRDAINQANSDTGEDLVVFDRSLFSTSQTITLNLGELDITHNLDIIAPRDSLTGGDLVTVSGNKASRVFEIGTGATVTLLGLIEADGNAQNGNGGGILNSGVLTLDSNIIRNNSATNSGYGGGNGGGIYNNNNSTLSVRNSSISCNLESNNGYPGFGGGIYNSNGTVVLSNSTINGNREGSGNRSNQGGGIYNDRGSVEVSNTTINGNGFGNGNGCIGGGIYNESGTVDVSNSTISDNIGSLGGGISSYEGTMTVSNSIISGNVSPISDIYSLGGGINNDSGILKVSSSIISGNSASLNGGGIYNQYGNLTLVFSTLTLNQALSGGGVFNTPSPVSPYLPPGSAVVRNTIIAGNFLNENGVNPDVSGIFTSNGYNLIGDSTGSTGFDATGDIVGTSDNPIDPRLAPLDFNGGPIQTIALLPDSPAIDAGDPTILDTDPTTDQRGFPRVSNGRADIGAFEVQV